MGAENYEYDYWDDRDVHEPYWLGEFIGLVLICPIAVCVIQLAAPTILYEIAPRGFRGGAAWLLNVVVLFMGYSFPLAARFLFLKRPVKSLAAMLLLFPITMLTADFFTSVLLRFSILSRSRPAYVPAFYLVGLGALFILLYAHCTILGLPSYKKPKKSVPFFPRLVAYTFTLTLSVLLSILLCAALNREKTLPALEASASSPQAGEAWQILKLTDAGVMEIPGDWYVEDSNGKLTQTRHEGSVQYVKEALTALPYGQREAGLDFAFELLAYWWTNLSGHVLHPPKGIVDKIQENQLEAVKLRFPDAALHSMEVIELEGRPFSVLTIETSSVPGHVVRFKNIVLEHEYKVHTLTISYPAHEENFWSDTLGLVLSRWRFE